VSFEQSNLVRGACFFFFLKKKMFFFFFFLKKKKKKNNQLFFFLIFFFIHEDGDAQASSAVHIDGTLLPPGRVKKIRIIARLWWPPRVELTASNHPS